MIIDWTAAPEGTTHATIPNGDPRWYKLEGGKVFCWGIRIKEWAPSFFLTVDEIAETGLRLYANGEQSELAMLREQRDALLAAVEKYEIAFDGMFAHCCSNGVYNHWGRPLDCSALNEAHRLGEKAIKVCRERS